MGFVFSNPCIMKHILSLVLLSFLAVVPCQAGSDNVEARQKSPRTLWCMASDDNDLAQLLESEGFRLKRAATIEAVLSKAPHHAAVLLLGNGTRTVQQLTADNIRMIEQKKLRVFADFAAMPDAETQTREVTVERVVVTEPMGTLKPMDLLTVNRARFISCQPVVHSWSSPEWQDSTMPHSDSPIPRPSLLSTSHRRMSTPPPPA